MSETFFDAHLDLAALAVNGRDMSERDLSRVDRPWPPAAVTLPSLVAGGVRFALGTIFTQRDGADAEGYPAGDTERAHKRGRAQLEAYLDWHEKGLISLGLRSLLADDPGVGELSGGMGVAEPTPFSIEQKIRTRADRNAPTVGILMENADPIRTPDEVAFWKTKGLVAVGLTWALASRYAAGNETPEGDDTGVTGEGRALVAALDENRIVHDLSHLSQRATDDLLSLTDRPVMASHSNCRSLLDGKTQRHLSDETIREIGRRGGVIGLVLVRNFVETDGDATIDLALDHVERVCELTGSRAHVGIGSDMDGGFGADDLVAGIRRPADLSKLTDGLRARGWSDDEIDGFARTNWLRFFDAQINARASSEIRSA